MTDLNWLTTYGLNALLTGQDDPALWEAALRAHWPPADSPDCLVPALRFKVGRRLAEGEQPQGETNQAAASLCGMVDVEEWCFERVGPTQLRVATCPAEDHSAPPVMLGMGLADVMAGTALPVWPQAHMDLGISRPSRDAALAVVHSASLAGGLGEGQSYLWQRLTDGSWQQTDQRITWWIT